MDYCTRMESMNLMFAELIENGLEKVQFEEMKSKQERHDEL